MYLTFFPSCFGDNLMLYAIFMWTEANNSDKIQAKDSDKFDLVKDFNVFHAEPAPPSPSPPPSPSAPPAEPLPRHKDALRLSNTLHPSEVLYNECKEICEDPEKRKMFFSEPSNTRRVRTWAGDIISPEQAANFKRLVASHARVIRPFSKLRPAKKPKFVKVGHYPYYTFGFDGS